MNVNMKKGIIVLGGHIQALGIVRAYGKMGLPVIIIDNTRKNIARHSKYCTGFFQATDECLLEFLLCLGERGVYDGWIVFPTNDFHVYVLSVQKAQLEKYYTVTTDHWDTIKIFYDKTRTYRLAQKLNIPIPKTYFPQNRDELKTLPVAFPCIIKPAVMHEFYSKMKRKVLICNNMDELVANYNRALQYIPSGQIIIQDIIPGRGKQQFSACFLFLEGRSYVTLTAVRLRQHPIDFGNATTYAETVEMNEIVQYAEKILKEVHYNGLCEVEFKFDERDAQFKLLEVNPRTWKWHSIANRAGAPFLEKYYNFLNNEIPDVRKQYQFASFRHALTDFPVQLKLLFRGNPVALRVKKPVVRATWSAKDINPWIFEKLYLYHLIRKR